MKISAVLVAALRLVTALTARTGARSDLSA
jgi:hypothetical protein